MISFDFEYYQPQSIEEAISQYHDLRSNNKSVMYYGGGTEFISRARKDELKVDAIIDLKDIPECNELKVNKNQIVIGSTNTLTQLEEANVYPLLSNVSRQIATRTARNKITIGGNILSHLIYRETLMPFLLADSEVMIAGEKGVRKGKISELDGINLAEGEFVLQIITDQKFAQYPNFNRKQTKHSKINYPIVSLAAIQMDEHIRVACSGVYESPFLLGEFTANSLPATEAGIEEMTKQLQGTCVDDMQASANYRRFVLETMLTEMLETLEGAVQ